MAGSSHRDGAADPTVAEEQETEAFLEHDQFVAHRSAPVPRARLGTRARAALWALRIFAITVSAMVLYTFVVHTTG